MVNKLFTKWSKDGLYCDETQAECKGCDVYQTTGMHKNGKVFKKCHMPSTIKVLNKLNIPKTETGKPPFRKENSSLNNV